MENRIEEHDFLVENNSTDSTKFYYPVEYDQSIIGLCNLYNANSLNKEALADYENYFFQEDELFLVFKDTYCKLHIAKGGAKGEFESIIVAYEKDLPRKITFKKIVFSQEFKTNNGIRLGMDMDAFIKSIPKNIRLTKVSNGKSIVFSFFDESMPYRATYLFSDNRLIRLEFGFSED